MTPQAKSAILTVIGYILGCIMQFIVYPILGLTVSIELMLTLGLIFTAVGYVSNLLGLKLIEYIECIERIERKDNA